ncbi:hypothetical protein QQF64_006002 [Cirrhinus molitorella]|uniref:Secreted protein n=1 Tax=Cirrhinus molitorella TaxID=172907 RepID=A0ABR3MDV5_9TELE
MSCTATAMIYSLGRRASVAFCCIPFPVSRWWVWAQMTISWLTVMAERVVWMWFEFGTLRPRCIMTLIP